MTNQPKNLTREQRAEIAPPIISAYQDGATIRALAAEAGRSYGWVHRLLVESGVKRRPRGGAHKRITGEAR